MQHHDLRLLLWIVPALLGTLACDRANIPNDTKTKPIPKERSEEPASLPTSAPKTEPTSHPSSHPEFDILDGTPFDEEHRTIRLTPKKGAKLLSRQSCELEHGEAADFGTGKIAFSESVLYVKKGRSVSAKSPGTLQISPLSTEQMPEPAIDIQYAAKAVVEILKYDGEGMCVVKIENMKGFAACPDPIEFEADDWAGSAEPTEYFWCVKPEGHDGWVRIEPTTIDVKFEEQL